MLFVKLSIFGTSFEVVCSSLLLHLFHPISGHRKICQSPTRWHGVRPPLIPSSQSRSPSQRCFRPSMVRLRIVFPSHATNASSSPAKDQLTGAPVDIKKIMKPFSTPVLSKRTYRELKLLKHIQHENARLLRLLFPLPIPSLAR